MYKHLEIKTKCLFMAIFLPLVSTRIIPTNQTSTDKSDNNEEATKVDWSQKFAALNAEHTSQMEQLIKQSLQQIFKQDHSEIVTAATPSDHPETALGSPDQAALVNENSDHQAAHHFELNNQAAAHAQALVNQHHFDLAAGDHSQAAHHFTQNNPAVDHFQVNQDSHFGLNQPAPVHEGQDLNGHYNFQGDTNEHVDYSSPHILKIPVPQPYPVHVPVKQPFTVPIYKLVTKEIEKKVPIPVQKLIPVYKEKPVKVIVERHHPVHVYKPYAVPVPIHTHVLLQRKHVK